MSCKSEEIMNWHRSLEEKEHFNTTGLIIKKKTEVYKNLLKYLRNLAEFWICLRKKFDIYYEIFNPSFHEVVGFVSVLSEVLDKQRLRMTVTTQKIDVTLCF